MVLKINHWHGSLLWGAKQFGIQKDCESEQSSILQTAEPERKYCDDLVQLSASQRY